MTLIQTKQKRAGREQRNKYKPRTETSTKQEQTQEQHLTIRHAGRPADWEYIPDLRQTHLETKYLAESSPILETLLNGWDIICPRNMIVVSTCALAEQTS